MAESAAHKWGQIIGDFIEEVFKTELQRFAKKHRLYLDTKGDRLARPGKKVSWIDNFGNSHDLDFVLEKGGTDSKIGTPVAFIESAWRRYTKHSRNKAQEIQGAILPLLAAHKNYAPFIGVMLAGEFTETAMIQLKSIGFTVLYFPYRLILKGFSKFNLDASSEESTEEKDFYSKINNWKLFTQKEKLAKYILRLNKKEVSHFFINLEKAVLRQIESVVVLPLHGKNIQLNDAEEAIKFIKQYPIHSFDHPFLKYEIIIKYNNGDKIEAVFREANAAIEFLTSYKAPQPKK